MDPLEELIRAQPGLSIALGVLGLVVGSFLNVVIHRLPKMMERQWERECAEFVGEEFRGEELHETKPYSLAFPGSHCPSCGAEITALQNIPVLSYLFLRGRCANCGVAISVRYPLVELLTAAIWILCGLSFGVSNALAAAMLLTGVLIALTAIDLDHQLLPDSLTLPLLWVGLLINIDATFVSLESAVLGAVFGYLCLWSVYWLFKIITGKEGMGYGDFKLLAALGAWFGLSALPTIVLLSSLVGAVIGIALIVTGRQRRETPMPFGPFLTGAGLIHLFYPDVLIGWIAGVV
ncbi:prepilin signal peptidase PulO-like peptidase [gamma proteobacterium HIMB55]|nr:prepilin signal peptidase PulO-like peptidase [gamma proteobacterium HIMB55]